ncbi:MAG: hypothetical protein EAZ95_18295 [Bacteroidetes bacterium]|nr:MAG: hypothetical protein EAZ95_18295 [Bacteroidota bacterium]
MKQNLVYLLLLLACPAWAQDFELFKNSFPTSAEKPEKWVFDSTYLAMCENNLPTLKPIPAQWANTFIHEKIYTSKGEPIPNIAPDERLLIANNLGNVRIPIKKKETKRAYYFLQKVDMMPHFSSFLVYYNDKSNTKYDALEICVLLLHYTPSGELVSAINVLSYFTFMSVRLTTTEIRQDFSVCNIDRSYSYDLSDLSKDKRVIIPTPDFVEYKYYQLDTQTALYTSIQAKYFPLSGLFFSEEEQHEIEVEQNQHTFFVVEGKKGDDVRVGVAVTEYDTEKGTFKAQTMYGDEWAGEFSADKNTLTITKPLVKSIYKRVK